MIKFPVTTNWYKKAAELEIESFGSPVEADEGSAYKVPYTKILDIQPHPNAERLEIATVYGFQVIVRKFEYSVGSEIFYIPIDSIVIPELEAQIFGPDSKIKLNKFRVRQIRLRGLASQGMILSKKDVVAYLKNQGIWFVSDFKLEQNYASLLKITKYEPPEIVNADTRQKSIRNKPKENAYFHQYGGINNFKWFPLMFKETEEVVVQEKLHGSNIRFSYLPVQVNTLWKKILKFFNKLPEYEYCYGSNRVQISHASNYKGFFGTDIYGQVIERLKLFDKIKLNETVYGELIGEGIQKNYHYGHKEHHVVIFDVKIFDPKTKTQMWLSPDEVEAYAKERGFDFVPILYKGPYIKDFVLGLAKGDSTYYPTHKVREGIVLKSKLGYNDESCSANKRCLKVINEDYLADASNTDSQ